ncbi:MAG: SPASM domain-containing protein [Candidatus Cloacimonetes bacterium]|nr:SPASM domain-containing protein [Candidatus Cloacimonadota bacterium]
MDKLKELYVSAPFRNVVLNHLERSFRSAKSFSLPIVIQLELTNLCNLSCSTCAHSYWDASLNKPQFLNVDLLASYEFLYETCSEFLLGGYGEPLLNKAFDDILNWTKRDPNKIVTLITNATLFPSKINSLDLIDIVTISMDGVHNVYEEHRHTPFQNLQDNLDLFRAKYPNKRLDVNLVWNKKTHQNLLKVVEFLNKYNVTKLNLLPEKIYSTDRLGDCLFDAKDLHGVYVSLQEVVRSTNIKINYPNFLKENQQCNQPLDGIFILADGEIMACCSAIFRGNNERFSLGYLKEFSKEKFLEFFNQEKMIEYRRARLQGEPYKKQCEDCSFRKIQGAHLDRSLDKLTI